MENHPETMPITSANMVSTGIMSRPARTRGMSRWEAGDRPRLSRASISSVTRIVPSSAAGRAPPRAPDRPQLGRIARADAAGQNQSGEHRPELQHDGLDDDSGQVVDRN